MKPVQLFILIICIATKEFRLAETLDCYSCSDIPNISQCNKTSQCTSGQSCSLERSNNVYRLGCISNQQCGSLSSVASSLVGRSQDKKNPLPRHGLERKDAEHCFECCSTDICNINLCQHLKPTICIDDAKVDCAWMNSRFNICQIIHEAKSVCPKFCGLCSLIDGHWGSWSSWSRCDVTCANGTQTRSRTCANPTPVHGGLECPGDSMEIKACTLPPCPVTPTVAFRSHNVDSVSLSSRVLVFTTVTLNIGNGYDSHTGIFTAPLPGTYIFSVQFCFDSSGYYMYYAIVHNQKDIESGRLGSNGRYYQCLQASTVAVLNVNDTVSVRCFSSSGNLYQDANMWNSFSGSLVHI